MAGAWKTRFEMLAAAAGTVVLIQLIGTTVMVFRLNKARIPHDQTVAALPDDLLFVIGAGKVLPFLAIGAIGLLVLHMVGKPPASGLERRVLSKLGLANDSATKSSSTTQGSPAAMAVVTASGVVAVSSGGPRPATDPAAPDPRNPKGDLPGNYIKVVAIVLGVSVLTLVLLYEPDLGVFRSFLVGVIALAACYIAAKITQRGDSLGQAGWGFLVGMLVIAVGFSLLVEDGARVKLDVAAVERKSDHARLGGFLLARSDGDVYLVVRAPTHEESGDKDCQRGERARYRALKKDEKPPDTQDKCKPKFRVAVIAKDDVAKLVYGPRAVPVAPAGIRRATRLARLLDEKPPRVTPAVASGQALRKGVRLTVSCNERCAVRVRASTIGTKTPRIALTAKRIIPPDIAGGFIRSKVPARFVLTVKRTSGEPAPKIANRSLRLRIAVIARDQARNYSSNVHTQRVLAR